MARHERKRGLEQAVGRMGVAQVGEADDQRAPRAAPQDMMENGGVIRFEPRGLERASNSHQVRHLRLPLFRLGEGAQLVVEDGVADQVALVQRDLGQMHRGVDRVIELPVGTDFRAHQAARIEQDHQALVPFRFVLAADQFAALGGGFPVDVAEVVVALVLAQRFKFAAFAAAAAFLRPACNAPASASCKSREPSPVMSGRTCTRWGRSIFPWRWIKPSGPVIR
jgi:hypothetical protein